MEHIILISIDTCRADYLSCYGYQQKTTPHIDAFAEEAVLFEHAITPVPLTLPAHGSMLTGTIPPYHRVHDNLHYQFADDNTMLAELMKEAGYSTAGFVSAFVLDERFGISQGFDFYDDEFGGSEKGDITAERVAAETTRQANRWLDEHNQENFFLFVHYYDPHTPLAAPEPFAGKYGPGAYAAYAAEIAYTDHHIGKLLDKLKSLGLYDSSLIIITADHGEAMGEHGEQEHGYFVYDCSVRVPFIIKKPGNNHSRRVKEIVGIVDIVPTVCSMVGMAEPEGARGVDLSGYLKGEENAVSQRYLYSESLLACDFNCNPLQSVSSDDWKYIRTTREELYNLKKDPQELSSLAAVEAKRARMMKNQLEFILENNERTDTEGSKIELDQESKARLASLGYVGSGHSKDNQAFDRSKNDAKDFISFHFKKSRIEQDVLARKLEQAKRAADELIKEYPRVANAYFLRGQASARNNDWETALKYYSRALELDPDDFHACLGAGRVSLNLGKTDDAVDLLKKALILNPDFMEINLYLGIAYKKQEKCEKAIVCLEKMVKFNPDDEYVYFHLAQAYIKLGNYGQAVRQGKEALRLKPDWPYVLNNVAWLSATETKSDFFNPTEALKMAQKACELTGYKEASYMDTLTAVYAAMGQYEDAVAMAQKALSAATASGDTKLAEEIKNKLNLYKQKQSHHQTVKGFN